MDKNEILHFIKLIDEHAKINERKKRFFNRDIYCETCKRHYKYQYYIYTHQDTERHRRNLIK